MKRLLNVSTGPRTLKQGGIEVKLPVGGFCDIENEQLDILLRNHVIQKMVDIGLVSVSDGPLNKEVPLKSGTTSKEIPERLKPREEDAEFGKSTPDKTKVESVAVEAKASKAKGQRAKVTKAAK